MKLEELIKFDPSLEIIDGSQELEALGICDSRSLNSDFIFFIKNKKFFEAFEAQESEGLILVFDKTFYDSNVEEVKSVSMKHKAVLTTEDVNLSMSYLSKPFFDKLRATWNDEVDSRQMGTAEIDPSAYIAQNVFLGKNVKIGKNTTIHPGVVVMSDVTIGEDCEIFPNTTLYQKTQIGNHVRIHAGCAIGSDGFGYNYKDGVHHKLWHLGGTKIEDHVEIGSNTSIDKGAFSYTVIGAGSKLDNQVHVAHNVQVGSGVILCGQVALAGSAKVGAFSVFGGKAALGPDCEIVPGTQVAGNAMVQTSWTEKLSLGGHPARPLNEWLRGVAYIRKQSLKKK